MSISNSASAFMLYEKATEQYANVVEDISEIEEKIEYTSYLLKIYYKILFLNNVEVCVNNNEDIKDIKYKLLFGQSRTRQHFLKIVEHCHEINPEGFYYWFDSSDIPEMNIQVKRRCLHSKTIIDYMDKIKNLDEKLSKLKIEHQELLDKRNYLVYIIRSMQIYINYIDDDKYSICVISSENFDYDGEYCLNNRCKFALFDKYTKEIIEIEKSLFDELGLMISGDKFNENQPYPQ